MRNSIACTFFGEPAARAFLVIDTREGKEMLAPLARFNQSQVETSAAVIAVFADMNSSNYLDGIYDTAVQKGFMPENVKNQQVKLIKGFFEVRQHGSVKENELDRCRACVHAAYACSPGTWV